MTLQEIAQAIKFRREFLGLKQSDLAEMSGVTIKTIHLIETASGNPSLDTLEKIAHVLGMELIVQVKKAD